MRNDDTEKIDIGKPTLERYAKPFIIYKVLENNNSQIIPANTVTFTLKKVRDYQGETLANPSEESFTAGTDGVVNFGSLGLGTYELTETKTAQNYEILKAPIAIVVGLDGVFSATGDANKIEYPKTGNTKSMLNSNISLTYQGNAVTGETDPIREDESGKAGVYKLINYKIPELPETGGPGLIMMERFGWILLLMAMLGAEIQIFGSRRKREE